MPIVIPAERAAAERKRQGLEPTVDDPGAITAVVDVLAKKKTGPQIDSRGPVLRGPRGHEDPRAACGRKRKAARPRPTARPTAELPRPLRGRPRREGSRRTCAT
jgi:hypothetical protein